MKNKILVHICCSIDSHFFLQELQKKHENDKIIGFFYDPNIHPFSEYQLRLLDVKRSCKKLGFELIEGDYDYQNWLRAVRGFENEPEKGKRCLICFDNRLEVTAQKAKELNCKFITTTLLTSPKKSLEQLATVGENLKQKYDVEFLVYDFRKNGGTQKQFLMAKEAKLYHQDYCGCIFALNKQRIEQNRLADELFSQIGKQILPESIESRIELYQNRVKLEEQNIDYKIIREKFLNYRLLNGLVKDTLTEICSYILSYSYLKRKKAKGKITFKIGEIFYFNREEIKFIPLCTFNKILKTKYRTVKELIFNPPKFEDEIILRQKLLNTPLSLSPIIILDKVELNSKYEIFIDSKIYDDVKERLIKVFN